jgi:DNA-directed RNA polymerase subunit RPC12/RpoP
MLLMCDLSKIKCSNCKKTLFHADLEEATISQDCKRCGVRNLIIAQDNIITIVSTKKEDVLRKLELDYRNLVKI